MKRLFYKTFLLSSLLILLGGCGDSSNGTVLGTGAGDVVVMNVGTEYTVGSGDKLVSDDNATISVVHTLDEEIKKVTLINGTATLLRGSYALQ